MVEESINLSHNESRVVRFMRARGTITSMDAFEHLKITRLAAVIFDLKRKGYVIRTSYQKANGTRYAIYSLFRGTHGT